MAANPFQPPESSDPSLDSNWMPAHLPLRVFAAVIDATIVTVMSGIASILPWKLARFFPDIRGANFLDPKWLLLIPIILLATSFIYHTLLPARFGATTGKRLMQMHVITTTGRRLTFLHSVARYLISCAGFAFFGLGYLPALLSTNRVTVHDWLSGTLVVHKQTA